MCNITVRRCCWRYARLPVRTQLQRHVAANALPRCNYGRVNKCGFFIATHFVFFLLSLDHLFIEAAFVVVSFFAAAISHVAFAALESGVNK